MTYWIVIDDVQQGPMSLEEVLAHPALQPETPVWHDGLPDWTVASEVPELKIRFGNGTVPPFEPQPLKEPERQTPPPPPADFNPDYNGWQQPQQPWQQPRQPWQPQQPWQQPNGQGQPPMPSNYLVWAILTTICCCQIFGIVAIIYAAQVSPAYFRGDYARAEKMSSNAQLWVMLAFVGGLIQMPFLFLFNLFAAA